ncbi:hypothetical protein Pint_20392 [Pistacia integerrima]|uniref:Uncharacterized protein n=1 Tax=Pistacia integerrima TaxID=434235 RepID=A0ACC0XC85_9ROSI|nr:hypothetical protein Pint_20392 [Pistacia integerrima]
MLSAESVFFGNGVLGFDVAEKGFIYVECSSHLGGKSKLNNVVDPFQDRRQLGNKNNSFVKWALEMDYAVVPLNSRAECDHKSRSCFLWRGDLVAGRNVFSLKCQGLAGSVYVHRVNEVDRDEWSSESDAIGFWEEAMRKGCPPYVITYCSHRVSLQARGTDTGKYEDIAVVICNVFSLGLEPNAVTYNTLLHTLGSRGCWDEVDKILAIMIETSHHPTVITYNILINGALCKEGMVDEALQLLHLLNGSYCSPCLITYNTVIDGLARKGSMEKAMGLYVEEAVEKLREMGKIGHMITNSAYKMIIHGLCRRKKLDMAVQVLELMISRQSKPDEATYSTILKSVAEAGMAEEANKLCQKLIDWKVLKEGLQNIASENVLSPIFIQLLPIHPFAIAIVPSAEAATPTKSIIKSFFRSGI